MDHFQLEGKKLERGLELEHKERFWVLEGGFGDMSR